MISNVVSTFQGGFWFVHIPFGSMVEFHFLPQFPVDHVPYLVVSSLILFFRLFSVFTFYMINHFILFTILSSLSILLSYIYIFIPTQLILKVLLCANFRRESVSLQWFWQYGQNSVSLTVTCRSHFLPSYEYSLNHFVIVYCIRLQYD